MARVLYGNIEGNEDLLRVTQADFDYEYPDGLDLKPGSKLHKNVLNRIMERASASASSISSRFDGWEKMDQNLTAYIRPDDEEIRVKAVDERKPVSIIFPYSYAILETLLSYMMAAFFRDPIFRYEGHGPDDVVGSILMEKVVALHCNKHKVMLNLHTMFRDAFAYGSGHVAPIWKHSGTNFSGNALINIDPYKVLRDPNVPADKIQDGEYFAWAKETNYMDLLTEEYDSDDLFNVKYLGLMENKSTSIYAKDSSGRNFKAGSVDSRVSDVLSPVTVIPMYIKIIPKEWKLGSSEKPEKWFFQVAADSVIITARPADFKHEKFPVANAIPDFDGYSTNPIGRLEVLSGMQGVLDWLFNSHIANVRKAINDTLIVDPSLVNMNDLKDPKPGKIIRLRRQAWGQGRAGDAIHQLKIADVTRGNVADSGWIISSMQTLMGTDAATMGDLRQGGPDRLTKAEFQGTTGGSVNRLERIAKITGLQAFQDIGEMFASHTQQIMDDDAYIKVVGSWQEELLQEYSSSIERGRMSVSPYDLDVNYDVLVRDGSIPGSNSSDVWMRMFDRLAQTPELAQKFDVVKIFKHIARNAGAKNVNEFVRRGGNIQGSAAPNEQVQQEVQAGNLIPIQRNS
ncbi:MAG: hypothetical protein GY861_16720 [bacterium]|nr:hypothetical protein [bacterium]